MNCSNCEQEVDTTSNLLTLKQGDHVVACICEVCQETVLTLKIVLARRTTKEPFKFEGYLPVATSR